jgi:hypothetical protein
MTDSQIKSRLDDISSHWSVLDRAADGSEISAKKARGELVLRYAPAIRSYVAALVKQREDAEDLVQDVLVRMMAGDFAGADPARGRFRDLLKVALRHMACNYWAKCKRRQTVPLAFDEPAADGASPDPWLTAWRQRLLGLAWDALGEKERSIPGSVLFTVLRMRVDCPEDSCQELAAKLSEKLGRPIAAANLRQQLRRGRVAFASALMEEVSRGLPDAGAEAIRSELKELGLLEYIQDLLPPK